MAARPSSSAEHAHSASHDELRARLHHPSQEVLAALLENPLLDEAGLLILLERKELPEALLEKIARQKEWMCSYRVKRGVARHPHTPPLLAIPLVRQLYLFDLVVLSLLPRRISPRQQLTRQRLVPLRARQRGGVASWR